MERKLPVLMYHHVATSESKGLTISVKRLEQQFIHLADKGYTSWFFSELTDIQSLPDGKHVVITFDDAYVSQLELAYPLLKKYGLKATFFVPLKYIGGKDTWNTGRLDIMNAQQLRQLEPGNIELGYHSFAHGNYKTMTPSEIEADLLACKEMISTEKLSLFPALAYPYGKYPRDDARKEAFTAQLKDLGISMGVRIGNRLNKFPFPQLYEVQRLDIKGEYPLYKFRRKLRFGKLF